jgi:hypothetical protein
MIVRRRRLEPGLDVFADDDRGHLVACRPVVLVPKDEDDRVLGREGRRIEDVRQLAAESLVSLSNLIVQRRAAVMHVVALIRRNERVTRGRRSGGEVCSQIGVGTMWLHSAGTVRMSL